MTDCELQQHDDPPAFFKSPCSQRYIDAYRESAELATWPKNILIPIACDQLQADRDGHRSNWRRWERDTPLSPNHQTLFGVQTMAATNEGTWVAVAAYVYEYDPNDLAYRSKVHDMIFEMSERGKKLPEGHFRKRKETKTKRMVYEQLVTA